MLIYNETTNTYTSDRPETHMVMKDGEEKAVCNAFSSIIALPDATNIVEVSIDDLKPYTYKEYSEMATRLIRRRYSIDKEFAIMRKLKALEMSPALLTADDQGAGSEYAERIEAEFLEYNRYVDDCKAEAKAILGRTKEKPEEPEGGEL